MTTETLMYNPVNHAQQFISASNTNDIGKLKEQGWLMNPKLVDMYDPAYKKHVMIPVQDRKLWEAKGYYAEPTMVYHPKEGIEMVSAEDAKQRLNRGWYLSPAHFPGNSEGNLKNAHLIKKEAV